MPYYGRRTRYAHHPQNISTAGAVTDVDALERMRAVEVPSYVPVTVAGDYDLDIPFRTKSAAGCRYWAKDCGARFNPNTKTWSVSAAALSGSNGTNRMATLNRLRLFKAAAAPATATTGGRWLEKGERGAPVIWYSGTTDTGGAKKMDFGTRFRYANGWSIHLTNGISDVAAPVTAVGDRMSTSNTVTVGCWNGKTWIKWESTNSILRSATPDELIAIMAWVASQPQADDENA
jgi:hypothetical protein